MCVAAFPRLVICVIPGPLWEGLMGAYGPPSSPFRAQQAAGLPRTYGEETFRASRQERGLLLRIANSGADGKGKHKSVKPML